MLGMVDLRSLTKQKFKQLSEKTLKVIAKSQDIEGYNTMTKDQLVESISSIYLVKLRMKELRAMTKMRGIKGYKIMSKDELIDAISSDYHCYMSEGLVRQIARGAHLKL